MTDERRDELRIAEFGFPGELRDRLVAAILTERASRTDAHARWSLERSGRRNTGVNDKEARTGGSARPSQRESRAGRRFEVEGRRDPQNQVCARVAERLAHRGDTGPHGTGAGVDVFAEERPGCAPFAAERVARVVHGVKRAVGLHVERGDIFTFAAEREAHVPGPQAPGPTSA